MKIKQIVGREILDSRANPTVEVDVILENGIISQASVPSGASTGVHEATELRDGGKRFLGRGVHKAVRNVDEVISQALEGLSVEDCTRLDQIMIDLDGTRNKDHLGANAILAVSIAVQRAKSLVLGQSLYKTLNDGQNHLLPVPLMNVLNGGRHADNSFDFQEFMLMPSGAHSFGHALQIGVEIYQNLKEMLKDKGLATTLGDEGGFTLHKAHNAEGLELLIQAIEISGYKPGKDVYLAIDCAASELYEDGKYHFANEGHQYSSAEMQKYIKGLVSKYPIFSIEDPLAEDDWGGYQLLTEELTEDYQIVGDDLFTTNTNRLERGIKSKCANAVLVKPNQIGTVSETIELIKLAQDNRYATVVSHRSGETNDDFIADLTVAFGCGQIKAGAPARGERSAKYNRLLRIEEEMGSRARYATI